MRAPNLVAILVLFALLATAAAPVVAQPAKNPIELYTEAKFQEESKGAVDQAIALYRQVWKNAAASASLRAQALYREGLCQVRKDDFAAARTAFERLLREYPGNEPSAHANLMLKTLGASKKGMAAPRDISIEVKEQLVRGTKNAQAAKAALKTLVFYGDAAKPALREALLMQDRLVNRLALNALARMGDLSILDSLIQAAGERSFGRYSSLGRLSREDALKSLCRAHKAAAPRVGKAYQELPEGLAKAQLMQMLRDLKQYGRIADYPTFLASEDRDMRIAAWTVYAREVAAGRTPGEAFLAKILELWESHPQYRAELAEWLFDTGYTVAKKSPKHAAVWVTTLLAAAKSGDPAIVTKVVRALRRKDVGPQFQVRIALLGSQDRKIREQAVDLRWKPSQPLSPLDGGQLAAFANALVDTAAKYRAREEQHSMKLLNALVQKVVPLLDPAAYAALANRIFTPPVAEIFRVDGPLNQQGVLGNAVLQIFNLSNIQGAYTYQDRRYSLAEKYVPVFTAFAAPGKPRAVRMRCFQSLGQIVQRAWSFLPKAEQEMVKKTYFAAFDEYRAGRLSQRFSQQLNHQLYNGLIQLAQQQPRVVTVDELLRHAPLKAVGPRGGRMAQYAPSIFQSFSPEELRKGFFRGADDDKIRAASLLELLTYVEADEEKRDKALRRLWKRAGPDERNGIVRKLALTGQNLKFLTEAIHPEMNYREADAIQARLRNWGSRAAVPGLIKLLDVRDNRIKTNACVSLGSLADPRAVPRLIELLAFHDGTIRKYAEKALAAIRNIDKKQAEWRDWYERQGRKGAGPAPEKKGDPKN